MQSNELLKSSFLLSESQSEVLSHCVYSDLLVIPPCGNPLLQSLG